MLELRICGRLACLFNTSFISGKIPADWNISRITPILKRGDPSLVSNYRPISLLSLVAKLQEQIVHSSLQNHLLSCNAISDHQFGFRPKSSTQEALVHMTQQWHEHLDDNASTICIFLDLSKAFDSIPHSGVIKEIANAGVCGPALKWFSNYVTNRRQFVALEGVASSPAAVTSGVPQGSILGPLLFLVAFNGIFNTTLSAPSDLSGYADDVMYSRKISCASDFEDVTVDLASINTWINQNGFTLNNSKTKAMLISRKRNPPTFTIEMNGQEIEQVSSFKLLGITIHPISHGGFISNKLLGKLNAC